MYQTDPPRSPKEVLPTVCNLPSKDPEEPGLPDEFYLLQPRLLEDTFCPPGYSATSQALSSSVRSYGY